MVLLSTGGGSLLRLEGDVMRTKLKLRQLDFGEEFTIPGDETLFKLERADGMYWKVSWFITDEIGKCERHDGIMYIGQEVRRVDHSPRT